MLKIIRSTGLRVFLIFILIAGAVLNASGCWDKREVERLGIVLAIGLDAAPEGKVKVIVQKASPSAIKGGGGATAGGGAGPAAAKRPYLNISTVGGTVSEALWDLTRGSSRQLFFAHNQIVIVSERLARQRGIREVIDFFERDPQMRRTAWLLIGKGDIASLLDEPEHVEAMPSQRIFNLIRERDLTSQFAVLMLGNFLELIESEGSQPYTAVVQAVPNPAVPEESGHGLSYGQVLEPERQIFMVGTAVFNGDRMKGLLNTKESRGLLWVRNKVKGGLIEFPVPEGKGTVTAEILRSKTKVEPEIKGNELIINVVVKEEGILKETTVPLDLAKPEAIKKLEDLQSRAIRDEIKSAVEKAQQQYGVDVFGFGDAVHRRYPHVWRKIKGNWQELFPDVKVNIMVVAKIRRTGLISAPVEQKQ